MKKIAFILLAVGFLMACSSDNDTDNNQMQNPIEIGEYSLVLNGAGFTEQRVELFNDTINFVGPGSLFAASDDFNNALSVIVPSSSEEAINTIEAYPENPMHPSGFEANTASFFMGEDVYRSENGTFELEAFEFNGDMCAVWTGNLNINFTLNGSGGETLNVTGTFEVFSEGCNSDN
ncbi:hypothetical protein [Winogradskyella sp.]|uniref:hypothetical protein n=1 Tax=Winogradskyella sp. TaxID=1883156 RepID=UPI00261A25D5|nr:hypothetical protein [Winogradskyella sp.]